MEQKAQDQIEAGLHYEQMAYEALEKIDLKYASHVTYSNCGIRTEKGSFGKHIIYKHIETRKNLNDWSDKVKVYYSIDDINGKEMTEKELLKWLVL